MNQEFLASTKLSHYRIVSKMGAGGMGEVNLAEDTRLDRQVALKILPEEFSSHAERMRRFVQEAKAASALNHPHIITIYEIGETDGTHYIATEYIEGETLRHHIQHSRMKLREVVDAIVQVTSALSTAHQAGIIHRDIKPENIMLRPDGIVKVLDFGLAKLSEKPAPTTDSAAATISRKATDPGTIMGTVQYMSPEQARGKTVDARTDIFSLGIVLYEMIAGRAPFMGESSTDVLAAILDKEPLPLSRFADDLPQELQRIVSKMLRKERDERYQTMKDVLLDLKELRDELALAAKLERSIRPAGNSAAENQPTLIAEGGATQSQNAQAAGAADARTTSSAEYMISEIRQHKGGVAVGLLVLLIVASSLGYWYFRNRPSSAGQIESIAVMPFVNESGNADVEYLSDGMTETLISRLSNLPNLSVKPRSSVFYYKGKETNPRTIGKELTVQAIVNGRVGQRGKAIEFYRQAIEIDRRYALAYNGIARAYLISADWYLSPGEALPRMKAEALRALEFDDQLAEAHTLLGIYSYWYERDLIASEREFKRAIELDPNNSEAHHQYGNYLVYTSRFDKGFAEIGLAQKLAPLDLILNSDLAQDYIFAGRFDSAIEQARKTLEMDQTFWLSQLFLGLAYERKRQFPEAIAATQKAHNSDNNPWIIGYLGYVYATAGKKAEAQKIIDELKELSKQRYVPPYSIAIIYAGLNDRDQAFEWLNKSYEAYSWTHQLNVDTVFDKLRADARFKDLLKRMNLTE